jgi:DNA-binding transcriptional LysR family regulator
VTLPLDVLPVFLAVAEAGSFASAGRKLNLSRSAIGKSVARLEAQVGARLLHRSTRSHTLTPEGEMLYEGARSAMAQLEAVGSALGGLARGPAGTLRVTAPAALGRLVARILQDLAASHPELALHLTFTDRVVDLIEEGVDLAVRLAPLSDASALTTKRLARMDMVLCTSPEYLRRRGFPSDLAALAGHDGIFYVKERRLERWKFESTPVTVTLPNPRIRSDDLEAMCAGAVAGLGIAWLPVWLVRDHLKQARLAEVLPETNSTPYIIHAVWPQSALMPLRLRLALDLLASRLQRLLDGYDHESDGFGAPT